LSPKRDRLKSSIDTSLPISPEITVSWWRQFVAVCQFVDCWNRF